jgi:hypothetical protein
MPAVGRDDRAGDLRRMTGDKYGLGRRMRIEQRLDWRAYSTAVGWCFYPRKKSAVCLCKLFDFVILCH